MLQQGQIIRYGQALYRVDYVNTCRAYIVPLSKRELQEGVFGDGGGRGVSIAATSFVEIVTDLERARDEMELAAVEAEIAATKAELARRETAPATSGVTSVTPASDRVTQPVKAAPKPVPHRREAVRPGGGWFLKDVQTPSFKEGTLAEKVWLWIGLNPGKSTADIVAGVKAEGAVAACVSRFHQSGLIEKR